MNKRDIKVGMRVRVKSLDDMKKGVGVKIEDNGIKFPKTDIIFNFEMKKFCGKTAIVKYLNRYSKQVVLSFDDGSSSELWTIIPQMLEPVVEEGRISGVTKNGEPVETKPKVCNLKISEPIETTEEPKKQSFTKKDLKFGNVVEFRNGSLCLIEPEFNLFLEHKNNSVTNPELSTRLRNIKTSFWETNLDKYNNNLKNNSYEKNDIMKVYEDYTLKNLLWERQEIQLSEREIEILKALKVLEFKYIARDSYKDSLFAYKTNPEKGFSSWLGNDSNICRVKKDLFDFVKWEDEKPYSIEELLENETN